MKNILVVGASGQLGSEIQFLSHNSSHRFTFADYNVVDITDMVSVKGLFDEKNFDYCINCAAYTAVDKAEAEEEMAFSVNVKGAENLAKACKENNTILIHISTDFVFDGEKNTPYLESDKTNPVSVYGLTKLDGEKAVLEVCPQSIVIRTAWLYSSFGNNFVKTMLKLAETREELGIISDQIGTPTYARDLANAILQIVDSGKDIYGVYHYSNEGVASWYDFAQGIFELSRARIKVNALRTEQYPTPAKRPVFSVMSKQKIKTDYEVEVPYWRDSLKKCLLEDWEGIIG